jgi:hypothetical protein
MLFAFVLGIVWFDFIKPVAWVEFAFSLCSRYFVIEYGWWRPMCTFQHCIMARSTCLYLDDDSPSLPLFLASRGFFLKFPRQLSIYRFGSPEILWCKEYGSSLLTIASHVGVCPPLFRLSQCSPKITQRSVHVYWFLVLLFTAFEYFAHMLNLFIYLLYWSLDLPLRCMSIIVNTCSLTFVLLSGYLPLFYIERLFVIF